MFVRSDTLLRRETGGRQLHAVSFEWEGFQPRLWASDMARQEVSEVDFWSLDIKVSTERLCVGSFNSEGYAPCPERRRVFGPFAQCQTCAGPYIPDQQCTFEPKCDGSICDAKFCKREHAIYLAFHGTLAKIGMTSSGRLEQRLIEQGADAFAVVARANNRLEARKLESSLSHDLKIKQRVSSKDSLANIVAAPPWSVIEARYAELAQAIAERAHSESGPLKRLDSYPLKQPLPAAPRLRETMGPHSGRVLGVKGKYLIYENEGLNALNMADLPARIFRTVGH